MGEPFTIRAATAGDLDDARLLFREYERWLGYDLCFQGFAQEVATLPGRYAPPSGRLYLADAHGALAGCIALRELEPGICEMKRLYVREAARGLGLGWALARRVVDDARTIGYRAMRLDTMRIDKMAAAGRLYEAMGFVDIPPYYQLPEELPEDRFMELDLTRATAPRSRA
jgi:ribosomal protein S18 acetylase RimI-like enzyme